MTEWMYSSSILDFDTRWSGQLHAPAALSLGKGLVIHCIGGWVGLTPGLTLWRRETPLASVGNRISICKL
jgi:hypothetical protein